MTKIAAGSADALGELYDRYFVRAFRVARSVCHDHRRAEDVVQEAFVSIFKSRRPLRSQRGTVAAWVLTEVLNRAIDVARIEPAEQAGGRVDPSRVLTALAALPPTQQEVVVLAYYGEMTHSEIAERLGVESRTVIGRLRLGMKALTHPGDAAGSSR